MNRSDHRDVDRATLLAALRPDSSAFVRLVQTQSSRIDWPWMVERAAAHKVIALLAARVEQCGLAGHVGDAVATRLQKVRVEARRHAEVAQATLRDLSDGFARERIPWFVVKGSVLAEHVYGDASLRRFFDVDVVVPPEVVERAEELLHARGYRLGQMQKLLAVQPHDAAETRLAESLTADFYRRFEYELPFAAPRGAPRLAVDLHWHIAPQARMKVGAQALWEQTVPVTVAGTRVLTLTPAATIIHLAVHATTCTFAGFRLLHLCDVAWAATRFSEHAEALWNLAEKWHVATHVGDVFEMTERALGVALPPAVRRAGHRPRARWRPAFERVARDAFLIRDTAGSPVAWWERAREELLWSLAMSCLRHNLVRSLRVRLRRLRWQWQRRRLPRPRNQNHESTK